MGFLALVVGFFGLLIWVNVTPGHYVRNKEEPKWYDWVMETASGVDFNR